eukprot:GEMP01127546.1.p1 GENE.GEMP01127546.1~~GEMP01127546.1.p1  ORF type:complete len:126 (+),score=39.54 GEMP01127546.1:164-541(+)
MVERKVRIHDVAFEDLVEENRILGEAIDKLLDQEVDSRLLDVLRRRAAAWKASCLQESRRKAELVEALEDLRRENQVLRLGKGFAQHSSEREDLEKAQQTIYALEKQRVSELEEFAKIEKRMGLS